MKFCGLEAPQNTGLHFSYKYEKAFFCSIQDGEAVLAFDFWLLTFDF